MFPYRQPRAGWKPAPGPKPSTGASLCTTCQEVYTPPKTSPAASTNGRTAKDSGRHFLSHFTDPAHEEALRRVGQLLYAIALEPPQGWPALRETSTLTECVAALCDVRFLAGYLRSVGREREVLSLSKRDAALSRMADSVSVQLVDLGRQIEEELDRWHGRS